MLETQKNMWGEFISSGKAKIEHFSLNTKCYIWQQPNTAQQSENTFPTVKNGGGSIMLRLTLGPFIAFQTNALGT